MSALGKPLPHESAVRHVSGEAKYTDDIPLPANALHAWPVGSAHAHARILSKDGRAARAVPGVHAVVFAEDLPAANHVGAIFADEPLLATDTVHCVGQPVAFVIAETMEACRAAAAKVELVYEALPALTDLGEGIAARSFIGKPHVMRRGEVEAELEAAPHRLSGVVTNGGQDHFYLEGQASVAIPGEGRTLHVVCSTQHPSEVQTLVAKQLGWSRNRVVVECPRMGGGFGGKETQAAPWACMAAIGATLTGRPVRARLDRDTDMMLTGRRHPMETRYDVGFDADGRVLSVKAEVYADAGWATDLSISILDRALFHFDNAYWLPVVQLEGYVVRTNRTSNTAFRGFGGPQGMVAFEQVLERIASYLGRDPDAVRRANLYRPGKNVTPYGQEIVDFRVEGMLESLAQSAGYVERLAEVQAFNAGSAHVKRGLAMSPVKFGISFTASFLNQAGAYLLLYSDGSAALHHGGTEMGQGLNTKMMQVAAHDLGAELSAVRHMNTRTDAVPNTSATAASSGADLNGQAVKVAAETLVARLMPVAAELLDVSAAALSCAAGTGLVGPDVDDHPSWAWTQDGRGVTLKQVCQEAYLRQVPLAATGFYKTPDIHYDRAAGHGRPFHYFAHGVSLSEVEVDGFTGMWRLRRVDVLHDVGDSLSPDIDRGQIEGAYIQGLGWLTMEELVFDKQGALISHSPSTYKIPAVGEAPVAFHVALAQDARQEGVIHGSKAVGEPPFMLAISAHLALCRAAGAFVGQSSVPLAIPATHEAILLGIQAAR